MDKKPKRMVPEVRFKGFTDDWEQHKLGEITIDMYNGQTPSRNNSEFWKGNIPWLTSGELNHDIITDTVEKITKLGQKDKHLRLIKKGTFVIAITGLEAPGTRGNCALLGIDTTINQSVMAIYPDHKKVTSDFLFDWYEKVGTEYGITYTQGTKQQSYNVNLLSILPIMITHNLKEQYKISQLLKITNRLISLQQRKLEQLKQLKKAMLRQLLASKELSPSIRFKNFTEAWEQRKLGDIGNVITGNTPSTKDKSNWTTDKNKGHIWITPTDINRKVLFDSERYLSDKGWLKARKIPKNSVLITSIASIGKNAINGIDAAFNQQINALILQNNNYYFVLSLMDKEKKRFEALAGQTATPIINKSTFSSFQLQIPSENEQNKIGNFFKKIDNLITLHQRETNILSNLKKFFLQNLFI
ncbi:restriction endonuclease subunit S [Limosilactobacillus sp. c11Ua_112_M]|uniref:restriction endonuclease subunit S n=1 Tax=Limosilactobacillus portuensis TaxID=2742601 RepID=UPI001784483C|nr:restriction endonuclease subunit S [Limosilactobacillus portuensis]MBD8086896.1 restriction endonuclease subunit S [Limosilactobacillus portuensis]